MAVAAPTSAGVGFAALDVFENEPHVSTELLALPNVLVQLHHGSATAETRAEFERRPLPTPVGG